jgi:hypothetical protein
VTFWSLVNGFENGGDQNALREVGLPFVNRKGKVSNSINIENAVWWWNPTEPPPRPQYITRHKEASI